MRKTLIALTVLILATVFSRSILHDPGYVYIKFHQHILETTVWTLAITLLIGQWIIGKLICCIRQLMSMSQRFKQSFKKRRIKRANHLLHQAIDATAHQNNTKARKLLVKVNLADLDAEEISVYHLIYAIIFYNEYNVECAREQLDKIVSL